MRLSRVYLDCSLELHSTLSLPKETAHYLSNVLRLRVADELLVFNEEQGEFRARVASAAKRSVEIELIELIQPNHQDPTPKIHLLLGLSRGDRMDFAVQKSTELGVSEITPVYTEHGEVRLKPERLAKKLQHWRRIAISACEQCGRISIPAIHEPVALIDLPNSNIENRWMLDPSGADKLPQTITQDSIMLLIGPEGGFSVSEIDRARDSGFGIIALGSRILRTETAPVAALAILQHKYGDM